jgi:hypothetical protein
MALVTFLPYSAVVFYVIIIAVSLHCNLVTVYTYTASAVLQNTFIFYKIVSKGKAIPLQPWTGPKCSRRWKLPGFKTIGI